MKLNWLDETRPFATDFDDIYYAEEDGLGETRYLFIGQNDLLRRFRDTSDFFTIGELGFGTGLNFLGTWQAWIQSRPHRKARLHYISCEKYPLSLEQIRRALSRWPELASLTEKFLNSYIECPRGFYRFNFDDDGIVLTLLIGDAAESLAELEAKVDAWYFDGFAPRKNPEIWSEQVFSQVARLSKSNATFATYTVTGFVRRHLQAVGFSVEKIEGFGRKRQMLRGSFGPGEGGLVRTENKNLKVAVIGAGLAGCALSNALAKRGYTVTLFDRSNSISSEGSGNPVGIAMPTITAEPTILSALGFSGLAYLKSSASIKSLTSSVRSNSGLLQFADSAEKHERFCRGLASSIVPESFARILEPDEASALAGVRVRDKALYHAHSTIHSPIDLTKSWVESYQENIKISLNTAITEIRRENNSYLIFRSEGLLLEADIVILASAFDSLTLPNSNPLPLRKVRGQIALVEWLELRNLKIPLCFENYITPISDEGVHLIGATYDRENLNSDVRSEENEALIHSVADFLDLSRSDVRLRSSRVSFRASCPGQEPIAGLWVDREGAPIPNAYVLTALASKGLIYSALLAEAIASKINGEPLPLPISILKQIEPSRFQKSYRVDGVGSAPTKSILL